MKTIIVTGGTGFIGAEVVKACIAKNQKVIVLVRENSDLSRLKNVNGWEKIIYKSLVSEETIQQVSKYKPDSFIHLAWKGVFGSERNLAFQITDNLPMAFDSVQLAKESGCKHWIGIGSQAEYGNQNTKIDENAATSPTTLYGKSKLATYWACNALCQSYGLKSSWIRVFSTYGKGDNPNWFIPYIINELKQGNIPKLTKCEQMWDFLNVSDAASAILAVANNDEVGVFNLGSGKVVSLKYVVELIKKSLNSSAEVNYGAVAYRPDQIMHLEADNSKLKKLLDWEPKISIEKGIEEILEEEKNDKI